MTTKVADVMEVLTDFVKETKISWNNLLGFVRMVLLQCLGHD